MKKATRETRESPGVAGDGFRIYTVSSTTCARQAQIASDANPHPWIQNCDVYPASGSHDAAMGGGISSPNRGYILKQSYPSMKAGDAEPVGWKSVVAYEGGTDGDGTCDGAPWQCASNTSALKVYAVCLGSHGGARYRRWCGNRDGRGVVRCAATTSRKEARRNATVLIHCRSSAARFTRHDGFGSTRLQLELSLLG